MASSRRRYYSSGSMKPISILIVDDEPDVREVLEEYLVAHGYLVIGARSAMDARFIVDRHSIDLALVDVHLSGADGVRFARHLRACHTDVAIVMLTSAGTAADRVVALEADADEHLSKPFDPREVLARIRNALRQKRPQ